MSMSHGHPASTAVEDYVLALYRLQVDDRGPVVGARLAEQLGVAPASVTEMTARLRREGLVEPGKPTRLSAEGLRMARILVSRHRLIERFLCDVLGFGWDEVHDEAHRLEHALSARVTERLAGFLGHPATCPHGHPIMEDGGEEPRLALRPLTTLGPGGSAVVRRIAIEDTELLGFLRRIGIGLDTRVRVAGVDAFNGPLHIEVDGRSQVIGREAAGNVLVEAAST